MLHRHTIITERLSLRPFMETDITDDYISWLNDPDINQFLESRFTKQTEASVKEWVNNTNLSNHRMLFGIFSENIHIGNFTFYMIDKRHRSLKWGITIGRKGSHKQGFANEVLEAAVRYVFEKMRFNRFEASIYDKNIGAQKMMESVGFRKEAVFEESIKYRRNYINMYLYVLLRKNYNYNPSFIEHYSVIEG